MINLINLAAQYVLKVLDFVHNFINTVWSKFADNGWNVIFTLIVGKLLKTHIIDPFLKARSIYVNEAETNPDRVKSLREEMLRTRDAQQKLVKEQSLDIQKTSNASKLKSMEKKRVKHPMEYKGGVANRLGGVSSGEASNQSSKGTR
mmetsp:Transcript_6568/g.6168  ORF Transcript_6568/g.6168 Transcript_6568/m.6168 type:complete len:147 (-) Transcript_6568:31-471(-)|eukprot:CAMPEP_0197834034 /NCGR_PEP_ID=MMETSP1437-20131217/20924_1 /TAXON_ID=49252 ORGANISM="Eucampia antarctica, Strain CCMP1452" /NCGR_SAMPLE_ID=MMETSP1437 /ASSEMBLY_ACC=CAM_ASM_001096 /LENGTH=146 /DNA_ID=CAMNT_0043438421 /DNA_START=126 /DNA_END=566 /DNA_ORIENTATION=+